ncbi:translation elongation factor Ts [Mesomycoplasma moatsii]|uniref:translation elongation factor Ts n=1 Tax=Mesomycoplasma moatsii TaxID=171287 RepID=UPI0003B32F33
MGDLIKKLREITGAGFVDCKKALEASNNDIDAAIEWLQKNGAAKAIKKAGNIAADGMVAISKNDKVAVIYEVNSQTDFVAMNEDFKKLVNQIGNILISNEFTSLEEALNLKDTSGKTIEELTVEATAKIGEKIALRRIEKIELKDDIKVGTYVHFDNKKAAIFVAKGGDEEKLKGIAMHIVAMNPEYMNEEAVPKTKINELKLNFSQSPALQGKPEKIQESILAGMLRKELSNYTLTEQDYVVESGKTVGKYLQEINSTPIKIIRYEVGEGIEKHEVDFAAEVAAQMKK